MNQPDQILDYLRQRLPGYPFDPELDRLFVDELIEDFNHLNILEQTKAFRWYHHNQPSHKNLRLALRRWLSRGRPQPDLTPTASRTKPSTTQTGTAPPPTKNSHGAA